MIEVKVKSMIRAYRLALEKNKSRKKNRKKVRSIPFMQEMEEIFGDANVTKSHDDSIDEDQTSSTLPNEEDDEIEESCSESDKGEESIHSEPEEKHNFEDSKETGRNERFKRKLKFLEEMEKRREKIKERRFQELLQAIRKNKK